MTIMPGFALIPCIAIVVACGSDDPAGPAGLDNDVVFTRANGSTISFATTTFAWCGPWEAGLVAEPSVHVFVGGQTAHWQVDAVRADVTIGQPLAFPNSFTFDQPDGALVFVNEGANEASTAESNASGTITFEKIDCGSGGSIRFHINAVLGSEFSGGPSITASGTFTSPLTGAPQ
jgi:hypothetical protein